MNQRLATPTITNRAASPPSLVHAEREGFFAWLRRAIPTAAVVILLAGIGYWGHHTDWEFVHRASSNSVASDLRDPHGLPASECVECNPDLMPKPPEYGWDSKHGVHDCPLEHPDVAQVAKTPKVTQADLDRADRALRVRNRPANDPKDERFRKRIQFASAEAAEKAGIDIAPVLQSGITEAVVASGEIGFDQTRLARLPMRTSGSVWQVFKQIGDPVRKGDILALIDSAEVGKLKAEFLQSLVQMRQKVQTRDDLKATADRMPARYRQAEAAAREAEIRVLSAEQALVNLGLPIREQDYHDLTLEKANQTIRFAGLPTSVVQAVGSRSATANLLPVIASLDGEVLAVNIVAGETATAGKDLFVIGDARQLWLNLYVAAEDARVLKIGQALRFRLDGTIDEHEGKVSWISPTADEKTRRIAVRAEIVNDLRELRAGTFGLGRIILRVEPEAIVVPAGAVQFDGRSHFVFVRDKDYLKAGSPKVFHPRMVRVGAKDGDNVEIIAGLLPNEVVAAKGTALLLKELRKTPPPAPRGKTVAANRKQ